MTTKVRPCHLDDAASLYAIWDAVRHHNASIDPRIVPEPFSLGEFTAGLDASLNRPGSTAFVAARNDEIVGFISAVVEATQPDRGAGSHVTIGYVYVDPGARRAGVGQDLFDAVKAWAARRDGVTHFEMSVLAADGDAAAFWRSIGFTPFIERLWAPFGAG